MLQADALLPLLYRISIIIYNKSHIPAIMNISKTNAHGLGEIAHRVLLEISTNNPSVLKAQEVWRSGFPCSTGCFVAINVARPRSDCRTEDAITNIANKLILHASHNPPPRDAVDPYMYASPMDEECTAKCWALKTLANRVRSHSDPETLEEVTKDIYTLLHHIITHDGAISAPHATPGKHRPHIRLMAARLILQCSTKKH